MESTTYTSEKVFKRCVEYHGDDNIRGCMFAVGWEAAASHGVSVHLHSAK